MGAVADADAIATVQAAIDVGMTFIDTAPSYLTSEALIGKAISGRRNEVFLATKLSGRDHSIDAMQAAVEDSLRAIGTDYIDLYQLHGPQPQWPIEETMASLVRLRDQGKIRYIGVSNFSAEQTVEALRHGPVHSSQPRYNMLDREVEDAILPTCLDNGVSVIPHSVLAKGLLSGRYGQGHTFPEDDERSRFPAFTTEALARISGPLSGLEGWARDHGRDLAQLAIAWCLAQPAITSPIVGAKSPQQVRHNAMAADWKLSQNELAEIKTLLDGFRPAG
jgi:aryl-alcohol dehydrogenase-like predicted oxidoreductase